MEDRNRPPLWPFLILCATAAVWIDFGSLHSEQHPDALIQILASLQAWTPFFWEQDRYGTLVPLLASPVRDPLANLLVQNFMTVFTGLAAPFLLARYLFRDALYPVAAAVAIAAFLALATPLYRFEYLVDTGYGVPFALGAAALLAVEPGAAGRVPWSRRLLGVALAVLAHWVFLAVFVTLAPLIVLRGLVKGATDRGGRTWVARIIHPDRETILSLAVMTVGLAGGWAIKSLADDPWITRAPLAGLPVESWPRTWAKMLESNWNVHAPYRLWLAALALGTLASAAVTVARRGRTEVTWTCLAAAGAGATAFLFMGTRNWIAINGGDYRYSMPSLLLFQLIAFAPMLSPLRDRLAEARVRRAAYLLSSLLVVGATVVSYGWPSLAGVRANLDAQLGAYSHDAVDARCTHVAGEYWFVWKTVYHAKVLKAERGLPGEVWGIGMRGRPAWLRWRETPPADMRIGVQPDHLDEAAIWCDRFGLPPLEVVEKRPHLWVCQFKNETR